MMMKRTLSLCTVVRRGYNSHVQSRITCRRCNLVVSMVACRFVSSHQVSKNVEYLTQDNSVAPQRDPILNVPAAQNRPLLILLCWLLAKRDHAMKYANLYMSQGFDVLMVTISPWQLMWPVKGSRAIIKEMLDFLVQNGHYKQIVLHGFSVGGYMWGEALDLIQDDRAKYGFIINRIVGHVWDSAADVTELAIGTPKALFPNNAMLQSALQKYLEYHMQTFNKQATRYYIRSSQLFHTNAVRTPALMFVSKTDPVGSIASNMRVRDSWESMGTQVIFKVFENSPHVGHLRTYPKEYVKELYTFLGKLGMIRNEKQVRAYL